MDQWGQLIGKLKGNGAVALVQSEKDAKLRADRSFVSAVRPFRYRRFGRYVRSIRSPKTNLHTGDTHAKERRKKTIFLNLDVSTCGKENQKNTASNTPATGSDVKEQKEGPG